MHAVVLGTIDGGPQDAVDHDVIALNNALNPGVDWTQLPASELRVLAAHATRLATSLEELANVADS